MSVNKNVMIVGGHGKVALLAAPLLAAQGYRVSSVIRSAGQENDVREAGATPVVADVQGLGVEELAELFAGQDAIVWSAGAGGGSPSARTRWTATPPSAAWRPPSGPGCVGT